jgi:LysM repeat protein
MHAWIKLACVVLAWTILPVGVASAGKDRPVHPVQVSTRTNSISFTSAHPAARPAAAALTSITATVTPTAAAPVRTYVVQPRDTLTAIAARFAVRGGWPALYAANRPAIGPDPNALDVGVVLHLPGPATLVRYTITAGDTLSAIAARFAVRGGWPALYAANRPAIGTDPDAIHAGIRLTIPSPATSPGSGSAPGTPAPGGTAPSRPQPHTQPTSPVTSPVPSSPPVAHQSHPQSHASSGVPLWLYSMVLAVGLLVVIILAAEPLLLARHRRRRRGAGSAPTPHQTGPAHPMAPASPPGPAAQAHQTAPPVTPASEISVMPVPAHEGCIEPARIVMADHDRLVVTRSKRDDTIFVLRPPGEDPADILRVARLVLPEGHYGKLAEQLGMPANWPMNQ